ncbi:MAG: YggS family pyridoxal phosphate-dependent enzyme [Acidimicrobiales bacterium]
MSDPVALALRRIRDRIEAAGGDPDAVRILPVTKGHPVSAIRAVLAAGLAEAGESYAQELLAKAEDLDADVRWHMIGRLQSNKVRQIAAFVHLWQTIDRLSLAGEVARRSPGAQVLVQVNVTGAEQQGGCPPERVAALTEGCIDLGLQVRGLMALGPTGPPSGSRTAFRKVRELADGLGLPERSMGMSADLEAAVAEGSTLVRIGTALFGPRAGVSAVGN